jgi:hypothetical protein
MSVDFDLSSWPLDHLKQDEPGLAMRAVFEAYLVVPNGSEQLASGGIVPEVRGGLSSRTLTRMLEILCIEPDASILVGVWAGWSNLSIPESAVLVDFPNRPTYMFQTLAGKSVNGYNSTSDWYTPASVVAAIDQSWLLVGDVDDHQSRLGSESRIVRELAGIGEQ